MYDKQIKALYDFANYWRKDTEGLTKQFKIQLLREELAKPQYSKIAISTKDIREILRILMDWDK